MRFRSKIAFFISLVISGILYSQDTIKFKIKVKAPPKTFNSWKLADGYSSPNRERIDLFDKAGNQAKGLAIPANYVGAQTPPDGCENYFGICTYNGKVSFNVGEKMKYLISNTEFEDVGFLQAELQSPMIKKEYYVSFKVSLADFSGFATSGWGIYFSDKQITDSNHYSAGVIPQLRFPDVIKDKNGWTEIKFKYKTTGKEKYITLGCFGKEINKQEVRGGRDFALSKAYYYVTDIKFIEIPEDRDKDGVWDIKDRCPDVFGLLDFNGCPDGDGDGVPDIDDACPKVKGLLVFKGCPDTDGDGITDAEDKCPTVVGKLADGGCPVDENELAAKSVQSLINTIQFDVGKETIKPLSFESLDDVASLLKSNPFVNITINEFIDEGTDPVKAKALSTKRAQSVIEYLIQKGCNQSMIHYAGSNTTETNPATDPTNTRRVEFKQ